MPDVWGELKPPAIKDTLDTDLPRAYDKILCEQKCSALFEQVYENYPEATRGFTRR